MEFFQVEIVERLLLWVAVAGAVGDEAVDARIVRPVVFLRVSEHTEPVYESLFEQVAFACFLFAQATYKQVGLFYAHVFAATCAAARGAVHEVAFLRAHVQFIEQRM